MCDTDSIVYKTSLNPVENIPESTVLGGWEEEKISKEIIREFVGFGPKCYSILTDKFTDVAQLDGTTKRVRNYSTKVKGIRQTYAVQDINHELMKTQMLAYLSGGELITTMVPQWGIKTRLCDNGRTLVTSDSYSKEFKLMDDDHIKGRRMFEGGVRDPRVFPFGHH